jgi:hypothetical protein
VKLIALGENGELHKISTQTKEVYIQNLLSREHGMVKKPSHATVPLRQGKCLSMF